VQIGSGVLKTCTIERSFLAHVVGSVEAVYNLVNGSDTAPVGNLHQSYATIASMPGLMFGIINIVGQPQSLLLALPLFLQSSAVTSHILVECANLRDIREKYFTVSSLADLFNRVDNHTVIGFIKETHFYHQL